MCCVHSSFFLIGYTNPKSVNATFNFFWTLSVLGGLLTITKRKTNTKLKTVVIKIVQFVTRLSSE